MKSLYDRTEEALPDASIDRRSRLGPKLPVDVQRGFGSKNLGQVTIAQTAKAPMAQTTNAYFFSAASFSARQNGACSVAQTSGALFVVRQ